MTTWKLESSEAAVERRIVTGMIISDDFLKGIIPIYNPACLTDIAREVAGWCLGFFDKFGKTPPLRHIKDVFESAKAKGLAEERAALIELFLTSISQEHEQQDEFNVPFVLNLAGQYFQRRSLQILRDDLDYHLEGGNSEAALEKIANFKAAAMPQQDLSRGYTLTELLQARFQERKHLAGKLIAQGFNALGARMKFGKTHLCYNLATDVARGTPFLGIYPVEPGCVLYLDFETPENRAQEKFREILEAQGLLGESSKWGDRLTVQPRGSWPRMGRGGVRMLEKFAQEHSDLKLVIIDTWKLFAPPRKGKDQFNYDLDYQDIGPVKTIAEKYGLCILVLMHLNKSWRGCETPFDAFFGSTGFAAAADNLYAMTSTQCEADATLWGVGRYVDGFKIALQKDTQKKSWSYLGDAEQFELTVDQNAIVQALSDAGEMSPREIALAVGKQAANVSEMLGRMLKQGRIEKVGYGKYKIPTISPITPLSNITPISPISCPSNEDDGKRTYRGYRTLLDIGLIENPPANELYGPEVLKDLRITADHSYRMAMEAKEWQS